VDVKGRVDYLMGDSLIKQLPLEKMEAVIIKRMDAKPIGHT